MPRHFPPPLKILLLLYILLFICIFFGSVNTYAANPEQKPTITLEDLRLKPVTTIEGEVGDLLRQWYAEGTAAGNVGDYYDNRDGGHSHLKMEDYPQLRKIVYSKEDKKQGKDYAAQRTLLPYVVFGNSSTSASVKNGGSNVRTYYTNQGGMTFLYNQYRTNNLYIYPAHHDYRKQAYGDVFPTNSPYLIASKGSSGTDRKYMHAVAQILAAFRPEVKRMLVENGFLMPTIQMILRYGAAGSWQNYLEGEVHSVADIKVNNLKMIEIAHSLQIDEIPPLVQLKVIDEDEPLNGEDFFSPGKSIKLADTPCVIARIFRGKSNWHRMVVSAEESLELNGRELSYHWKVLQGDPRKISIQPLNPSGSVVEIKISYHDGKPITQGKDMKSNRVDIGVFVKSGENYSTPGFITSFSLDNEARTYDEAGRILEIGYGMGKTKFEIIDWNAFLKLIAPETTSRQAALLRGLFTRKEVDFINSIASEYLKIYEAISATKKELEDKEGADTNELKRKLKQEEKAKEKLVKEKQQKQDYSINDLVLRSLNNFIEDPGFITMYNSDLTKLFNTAPKKNRSVFIEELNQLKNYGIIKKKEGSAIEITPMRKGSAPLSERLTRFEYALLKNLNATAISTLFFPEIIANSFDVNFVDQRLVTPKFWRDVYHYNRSGQLTGWTRYSEEGKTEFNRDGLIILDKDFKGRCIKGQTVDYSQDPPERDEKGRRAWVNENPLKQSPGNEIWHYEFADDSDWQGEVVRIEKI